MNVKVESRNCNESLSFAENVEEMVASIFQEWNPVAPVELSFAQSSESETSGLSEVFLANPFEYEASDLATNHHETALNCINYDRKHGNVVIKQETRDTHLSDFDETLIDQPATSREKVAITPVMLVKNRCDSYLNENSMSNLSGENSEQNISQDSGESTGCLLTLDSFNNAQENKEGALIESSHMNLQNLMNETGEYEDVNNGMTALHYSLMAPAQNSQILFNGAGDVPISIDRVVKFEAQPVHVLIRKDVNDLAVHIMFYVHLTTRIYNDIPTPYDVFGIINADGTVMQFEELDILEDTRKCVRHYRCPLYLTGCSFTSLDMQDLMQHVRDHDGVTWFESQCKLCHFSSEHLDKVMEHIILKHAKNTELEDNISCRLSALQENTSKIDMDNTYEKIANQIPRDSSKKTYSIKCKCPLTQNGCTYVAVSRRDLEWHFSSHCYINSVSYDCRLCSFKTHKVSEMMQHIQNTHENAPLDNSYSSWYAYIPKYIKGRKINPQCVCSLSSFYCPVPKCRCWHSTMSLPCLVDHVQSAHSEVTLKICCILCSFSTLIPVEILSHFTQKHNIWLINDSDLSGYVKYPKTLVFIDSRYLIQVQVVHLVSGEQIHVVINEVLDEHSYAKSQADNRHPDVVLNKTTSHIALENDKIASAESQLSNVPPSKRSNSASPKTVLSKGVEKQKEQRQIKSISREQETSSTLFTTVRKEKHIIKEKRRKEKHIIKEKRRKEKHIIKEKRRKETHNRKERVLRAESRRSLEMLQDSLPLIFLCGKPSKYRILNGAKDYIKLLQGKGQLLEAEKQRLKQENSDMIEKIGVLRNDLALMNIDFDICSFGMCQ